MNGAYISEGLQKRKEMNAVDDNEIVELYMSRDETAIEKTAEKYGSRIYSLAYGILCDRQSAEECENDTYMKAWNSIPPNEPRNYLYPFLARITRHIALNLCRDRERLKRRAFICELDAEMEQCIPAPDDIERKMDEIALGNAINTFLGELDAEKRNIFIRRYWYLDSVADISARFAMSESLVKTTLFRLRIKLKKQLEKEDYAL